MKSVQRKGIRLYLLLVAATALIIVGAVMLARTFTHYNTLFLSRQDSQLAEMASAADENLAVQLNNFHEDLTYVLGRRGFVQAEQTWADTGDSADLVYRMQENLISQNKLVHALLALQQEQVALSTNGLTDYTFPAGTQGRLIPCISGDGTLYLALLERTAHAEYAALLDVHRWFADIARVNSSEEINMLLLGSNDTLLLHQWQDDICVNALGQLNEANCDMQAVQLMMESNRLGQPLASTYHLEDPDQSRIHEMRMAIIPAEKSVNGYFTLGLTGDYDEIVLPMQSAAIQLMIFGGIVAAGVLLLLLGMLSLARQSRRRDQELQQLVLKNEQTQRLLEQTQELAHHQRLETIGTLASSIAHEFNNLLTPIMGYSILTLESLPEGCDDLADNITEIYEASRKAKTIIARLGELSRKNVEPTFRSLAPDELIRKALEVAAPAQPAHVEIVTRLACGEHRMDGNETQLSQLLLNLIINAFHAMEEKGGTLQLSTQCQEEHITLRVEDSGTGIPQDVLPHIFEPFYTTKEPGKGTGLGLAIVHQVVESHHGEIRVESAPGEGSAFILRFPCACAAPAESHKGS